MKYIYLKTLLSKVILTSLFLLISQLGVFAQSPFYELHWANTQEPIFTNGGAQLTQTFDTVCSQLAISVTDPAGAPLAAHKSLVINPKDGSGTEIEDLSGNLDFHVRVRSRDTMRLGFQLRSGTGGASERTALQEAIVPGDTANWTEITFSINAGNLGGFDSTDLRDVWLFLDKGVVNFAGNEAYFDYFAIGDKPDPAGNSVCPLAPVATFPYTLHWADTQDPIFTNGGTSLTQTIDSACSQLAAFVTDPVGAPLPAHKSLVINPKDASGAEIEDLSGQMDFYVRVRSRETMRLGFQLRSGGGATSERTALLEAVVPGDTMNWTEITFSINAGNLGGFDSTDLRDIWLFLDKGVVNFDSAGNKIYFDYFAIGSQPDPADNSVCPLAPPPSAFPYTLHWADTQDPIFSNGGTSLTQTIDSACSQLSAFVTDPVGAPLPAHKSLVIRPKDGAGNFITDFLGQLRFYVRVMSRKSMRLSFQLRSGGGGTSERTALQEVVVPGDTMNWTEITYTVDAGNLGGFDSTDLRDIWLFLDKGSANFDSTGNKIYFDYFAIGSKPDPADNSVCPLGPPPSPFPYTLHWADTLDPIFTNGGAQLTQTIDPACSQLSAFVTDPVGDPLPAHKSLVIRPTDGAGNFITDFSGQLRFYARVRSRDSMRLSFQLRSGGGGTSERTALQEVVVPGDTVNWTEITYTVDAGNIGGFDSTDLRDIWLFLDKGNANFESPGNKIYFDYFAIGTKPDPADNSACSLIPPFEFPYTIHWTDTLDNIFTNGGFQLNQIIDTTCSQLAVSVADPTGDPLPAHKSLVINPKDGFGNELIDFSGQLRFYTRVRSKDTMRLGFQLRSDDGSSSNRSALQETVIPGDLMNWTEVSFSIDATTLGGFDSTDLRDIWLFLDKGDLNFAGDELYFDYFAIGSQPDTSTFSDCVETVGIEELSGIDALKIYPNPSNGKTSIDLSLSKQAAIGVSIYNINGQLIQKLVQTNATQLRHTADLSGYTEGMYFVRFEIDGQVIMKKLILRK